MKKVCMLGLVLLSLGTLSLAQDKVFDWVRASDEFHSSIQRTTTPAASIARVRTVAACTLTFRPGGR